MKKFIATFVMMAMMALIVPITANAQTSFYKRHRNLINIGIATGAGALIGAMVGGKRGAVLGAGAGAAGGAVYTYKINPKTGRYYRVYR